MYLSLADQYFIKALDQYPYNLEFVLENLQYALSADEDHPQALCLMGQLYMYQIKDYTMAKHFFRRALLSDLSYTETIKHLTQLYVWIGAYDKAEKLIQYGLKVPAMDQCTLMRLLAVAHEYRGMLKQARDVLKDAQLIAINANCIQSIDADLLRIRKKVKRLKKRPKDTKSRL